MRLRTVKFSTPSPGSADPGRQKALDGYFRYMEKAAVDTAAGGAAFRFTAMDRSRILEVASELDTSSRRAFVSEVRDASAFREVRAVRSGAALTRLNKELTPEGLAILHNFVTTVAKRNMKLIRQESRHSFIRNPSKEGWL